MDVDQDIMDVIKTARLKKGYTQEYVAKRVYLSAKAYSKIETGKNRLQSKCLNFGTISRKRL